MTAALALGALDGFHDYGTKEEDFQAAVLLGLARPQKRLSPKFFYDRRGSELFEQICELDEYYPTRTEIALLGTHATQVAEIAGPGVNVIEFGAGAAVKVQILLDALERPNAYVPIDISREHLLASAQVLAERYSDVAVFPVCADYTRAFDLPTPATTRHRLGFFPGSTIGNFSRIEAAGFLGRVAIVLGSGSGLLIGVDLKKDERRLVAAYDDSKGVTAAFNLNLLVRMKRELGADLDIDGFIHRAIYNAERGCIEMHLVSRRRQTITVSGQGFQFEEGETLHTEDSHKYAIDEFADLARASGWSAMHHWTDPENLFSLHYLIAG